MLALDESNKPAVFTQHFWGDRHTGFDILSQNLKAAQRSTGEFIEFLREHCTIDDSHYKSLAKLSKQALSYQTPSSFQPCWTLIHNLLERICQLQLSFVQDRQTLIKDAQKYYEEQQKQHKCLRDSEVSTQEVVHAFQAASLQLQKAKVFYHARQGEYQRVTRNESASAKDQEKIKAKLKKAHHEYKYSVEKYNNLRNQFVSKMHASCAQFQELEMTHLDRMREFLLRFGAVWSAAKEEINNFYSKFDEDLNTLSTERLLDVFVHQRGTGSSIPPEVSFEDVEVASLFGTLQKTPLDGSSSTIGKEPRVSSDLTVCVQGSEVSLNELSADSGSVNSVPLDGTTIASLEATATSKPALGSKRRLFRRYRNSPNETNPETGDATPESKVTNRRSLTSLSAFNLVAKLGSRHLGSSLSNVKEKPGSTKENGQSSQDWQNEIRTEIPKDEEGFSIPPSDPWGSDADVLHSAIENSSSESDEDIDVLERTFKGLNVKIRPVGQLAPAVSSLVSTPDCNLLPRALSNRIQLPVLSDHRGGKLHRSPSATSGNNLIQRLPLAPALPPPPTTGVSDDYPVGSMNIGLSPPPSGRHGRRRNIGLPNDFTPKSPLITEGDQTKNTLSVAAKSSPVKDNANPLFFVLPTTPETSQSHMSSDKLVEKPTNWCIFDADFNSKHTNDPLPTSPQFQLHAAAEKPTRPVPPTRVNQFLPNSIENASDSFSTKSFSPSQLTMEDRTTPVSLCIEPVTVAAALVETWHARFLNGGGSSFSTTAAITPPPKQSVSGSLSLAFPTAMVKRFTENTSLLGGPLILRLHNAARMRNARITLPGSSFHADSSSKPHNTHPDHLLTIPPSILVQHLSEQLKHAPDNLAPYIRLSVITYDVDLGFGPSRSAISPPINICTYWRCEQDSTDFRLDYTTHWPSDDTFPSQEIKGELRLLMKVDGGVSRMQSLPVGMWASETGQAMWKIPLVPNQQATQTTTSLTSGTVRAKFALTNGPGKPQPVSLQFVCEDCLASGLHVAIESSERYRLSLCKRRIVGDNYVCDPPSQISRFQINPRTPSFRASLDPSASSPSPVVLEKPLSEWA